MTPLSQTDTPTLQARETELRRELARIEYELAVRNVNACDEQRRLRDAWAKLNPPSLLASQLLDSSLAHR